MVSKIREVLGNLGVTQDWWGGAEEGIETDGNNIIV